MFGAMKLKLYHQAGGPLEPQFEAAGTNARGVPLFKWQTCLRSLVLVPNDYAAEFDSTVTGEWLEDESAYRRLLEIACGLHSPLIGETEVFGQFKNAVQIRLAECAQDSALEAAFVATLRQWSKALIEDVKLIRQKHLLDLGSQSYGSLVRREIRELQQPHIEFLGAGQLACEILPWLIKALSIAQSDPVGQPFVSVHVRNIEKARETLLASSPSMGREPLQFFDLTNGPVSLESNATRVLIVAAPLSSDQIASWVRDTVHYDLIIDLRGESRHDSLRSSQLGVRLRSLDEIFLSIESAREIALIKKNAALDFIEQRVEVRGATTTHRPFGWDDVC